MTMNVILFLSVLICPLPKGYTHYHSDHETEKDPVSHLQVLPTYPGFGQQTKELSSSSPQPKAISDHTARKSFIAHPRRSYPLLYNPLKDTTISSDNQQNNEVPASSSLPPGNLMQKMMPAVRSLSMVPLKNHLKPSQEINSPLQVTSMYTANQLHTESSSNSPAGDILSSRPIFPILPLNAEDSTIRHKQPSVLNNHLDVTSMNPARMNPTIQENIESSSNSLVGDSFKERPRSILPINAEYATNSQKQTDDIVLHRVKRQRRRNNRRRGNGRRKTVNSGWQVYPGGITPFCNNFGCRKNSRCSRGFMFDRRSKRCRRLG